MIFRGAHVNLKYFKYHSKLGPWGTHLHSYYQETQFFKFVQVFERLRMKGPQGPPVLSARKGACSFWSPKVYRQRSFKFVHVIIHRIDNYVSEGSFLFAEVYRLKARPFLLRSHCSFYLFKPYLLQVVDVAVRRNLRNEFIHFLWRRFIFNGDFKSLKARMNSDRATLRVPSLFQKINLDSSDVENVTSTHHTQNKNNNCLAVSMPATCYMPVRKKTPGLNFRFLVSKPADPKPADQTSGNDQSNQLSKPNSGELPSHT